MNGVTSMDVSLTDQQYGPARTGQPYPMSNVTHNHTFGLLADHHSMLESRIFALETRVNAMQKKMDEWDEWYNEWTPLFKLLYRIFSSFIWTPRYKPTDSAGSDVAP